MTDERLMIENAMRGERNAFNQLMKHWYKRIFNFTFRYLNNYDEASEITQQTFIKAYQAISKLKDADKFKSWLYIIASNECRLFSRKSAAHPMDSIDEILICQAQSWHKQQTRDHPDFNLIEQQQKELLTKALGKLSEEQRFVVIMKTYEGLTFQEIALILNESENTIKSRMYYGLNALRKVLIKWNIDKEAIRYE